MEPAVGSRQLAREVGALGHRSLWRDAVVRVEELRQRGIEPSAVAFNALVSALARGHRVERSAALLRDLRREELHLDLEAYGGAITACADAALWAEALGFLEEVLHSELLEDSALFNQALASCWRGHWRLAQALLSRMDSHALPRTVVSFEKAAAACSRAGRWQEAFYLFEEAWESLCPPNALMFRDVSRSCADGFAWEASLELLNLACRDDAPEVEDSACAAALGACGSASRWELVFTLLAESWEVGDPGGEAYSAAIRGLSRCSQWPHALLALAELRALRRTPDAAAPGTYGSKVIKRFRV
ncbi:unnamed protein product [Symbiodinium sp. CCMP2456]|nr:unnamed protein product [Symbiodinium sp. CCMP2456]